MPLHRVNPVSAPHPAAEKPAGTGHGHGHGHHHAMPQGDDTLLHDPVCGMPVAADSPHHYRHADREYRFV